jgi:poly-gamma-glutamate synthesis protein (capsule biosynthesis protein)
MESETSLLFLGDVVPYKPFRFRNNIKTVINLECPIIKDGKPVSGKINLRVGENYLSDIFGDKLAFANLANNHILDYGVEGLNSTIRELDKKGVGHFGLNMPGDNRFNPLFTEIAGIRIAFLSAICESTTPLIEFDDFEYMDLLDTDELTAKIQSIRPDADRIIVFVHCGIEESSYPAPDDIIAARKLIDAGADLIIGTHAHALQPVEKYKSGIIAYNLGNFIMPKFANTPSYFDENGIPQSDFSKRLMIWNRISLGLVVDMKTLEFRIRKYMFFANQIVELNVTPLDKYILNNPGIPDTFYESALQNHQDKRAFYRKLVDFFHNPHIPQKLRKKL